MSSNKIKDLSCNLSIDEKTSVDISGASFILYPKDKHATITYGHDLYYQATYDVWGSEGVISLERAYSLPPDFQTAEFLLKHGFVDRIIERKNIANEIGLLLSILLKRNSEVNSENDEQAPNISISTREAS